MFTYEIAEKTGMPMWVVSRYLNIGNSLGLCEYGGKLEGTRYKKSLLEKTSCGRPLYCKELDEYYHSAGLFVDEYYKRNNKN